MNAQWSDRRMELEPTVGLAAVSNGIRVAGQEFAPTDYEKFIKRSVGRLPTRE